MENFRIHLLGQPRFSHNGTPYKFTAPRTLPLLAYLLLHREAHVTRDTVAFTLWPDEAEENARTQLRRHLNYLKSALPKSDVPWFIAEADTVAWNDACGAWLDVAQFEAAVARPDGLDEAVELYGGDLLPSLYEDWIIVMRERLRSSYLAALDTLLLRARSRRQHARAAGYARRVLSEDPWREDALRHLIAIRYQTGDRTGALHEFDAFVQRLAAEMGVEPMPETVALRDLVLRAAPLPEDADAEPDERDAGNAVATFPFVGRAAQMEQLSSAWGRAARGRGSVVFVSGEAGIGKSRLVSELALFASAQGGRVLRGSTAPPERIPFQAILEALHGGAAMLATLDVRPIWLAALARILPDIELRRNDLPPLPALDPQRERIRLFESLSVVMNALAKGRPTLLVLEDLHWAGTSTLAAIEFLAHRVVSPMLVVGTFRTEGIAAGDPLSSLRRSLAEEDLVGSVNLGGLSQADVRELLASVPAVADAERTARWIHTTTGGNPLFAVELLRDVLENPHRVGVVGSELRGTIASRAARMTPHGSSLAAIASVVGETFDVEVLCNVLGLDENAVLDGLAELLNRRLVKEIGHARFQFAFTHQLVQNAIYERIAASDRRALHKRVAVVLESLPDSQRSDLAYLLATHYERAGEAERSASWYLEAARRSSLLFANDEAFRDADRGLALATDSGRLRFDLLLQREALLSLRGERAAQQRDLDELDSIVATLEDADARCDVVRRQVRFARARSDSVTEGQRIEELKACAQRSADPRRRAEALQEEAMFLRQASSFAAAYDAAESALALYREIGEGAGEVECLCLLSEIAATQGAPAEMQRYIDAAMASAQAQENKALIARAVLASAGVAVMQRDFPGALHSGEIALQLHREIGDREGEGEALARMATGAMMTLRPDEARSYFQQAGAILRSLGKRLGLGYLLFNTSALELQLGRLDDAQKSLDGAMSIFEALEDVRGRAVCAANVSMVRILQGDAREAKRYAEQALTNARAIASGVVEAAALSNLGNAERELREFDAAIAHINAALAIRKGLGNAPTFEELSDLARTQLEAGHISDAMVTADRCLRLVGESSHNTVWPHYCYWIAARVRRAAGDEQLARRLLARAEQLVLDQVDNMAEQKSRESFLDLPMNREISAAVSEGRWPSSG